jgi:hypothetical protein
MIADQASVRRGGRQPCSEEGPDVVRGPSRGEEADALGVDELVRVQRLPGRADGERLVRESEAPDAPVLAGRDERVVEHG